MNKYKEIDSKLRYSFRKERLQCAKKDGCHYISEHIVKTYKREKSLRATGKICYNISPPSVLKVLKACGEDTNSPGGRTWSKLKKDDVDFIKSYNYVNPRIYKNLAKKISDRISNREGREITVTWQTVKNVWIGKTYERSKCDE